ncbi:MAG TPA: class I SAM-dependent methyltransferase [Planktothrix sp.]
MPEQENQLSMTHVKYDDTPQGSIFGPGEEPVNTLLDNAPPEGNWIDLGAGDGRYTKRILTHCSSLTAFDIDERALSKLEREIDLSLRHKLTLKTGDLTNPLPFGDNQFDGTFCASTIHIFPERIIENIICEMVRIARPGGRVILDFFHNVERVMSDGKLYLYPGEISYDAPSAQRIIDRCFRGKTTTVKVANIADDFETDNGVVKYKFNGRLFVVECIA